MQGQFNPITITLAANRTSLVQLTAQGDLKTSDSALYVNTAASVLIKTGPGNLVGMTINSHITGTVKFWDNTSAATTVLVETMTLAVGERNIPFYGAKFNTGLFITIGGTANVTVYYN
jgi:hypothetical protein